MDLAKRIAAGESETLDFKFRIDDPKKIARSLAAFANAAGGSLLIGIKDNGKPVKINLEEEYHMIKAAAEMHVQPTINFSHKTHDYQGKSILEIIIPSAQIPHFHKAKNENGQWQYYLRIEDQSMPANAIIMQSFIQQSKWEGATATEKELHLLQVLNEKPLSFSQIKRESNFTAPQIKQMLIKLISWHLVDFNLGPNGCTYHS